MMLNFEIMLSGLVFTFEHRRLYKVIRPYIGCEQTVGILIQEGNRYAYFDYRSRERRSLGSQVVTLDAAQSEVQHVVKTVEDNLRMLKMVKS